MRRMLTETEVEKLDSIKPSEIEKLGAMQDPKTATANYVLTADGKGKATYKQSQSGARITFPNGGPSEVYKSWFKSALSSRYDQADFSGFKVAELSATNLLSLGFRGFPHYTKDDGSTVYIAPGDYFIFQGYYSDVLFGIKTSIYDQFVTDTANNQYATIQTGVCGYHQYNQN